MNRKEFGNLVRALREEKRDEQDHPWSIEALASSCTQLGAKAIGNLERGTRKRIAPEELVCLADGLGLTSGERKEFFAASVLIENEQVVRKQDEPQTAFDNLFVQLGKARTPAYMIDTYCDLVAANEAALTLFGVTNEERRAMRDEPGAGNMLEYVFPNDKVALYQHLMGGWWSDYAYQNMMTFRQLTLRYRATKEFDFLLSRLRGYREFRALWSRIQIVERDHVYDNEHIRMNHPQFGGLEYFSTSTEALTRRGKLLLCAYIPCTEHTLAEFTKMSRNTGSAAVLLAPWPKKNYP